MKTLICLPCLEQIPAFTVASLVNLERPDAEFAMELGSLASYFRYIYSVTFTSSAFYYFFHK